MKRVLVALALAWVLKWFGTGDALVRYLNGLPLHAQASAKVIVAPSQRNPFGWADSPYGLIYLEVPK